MAVPSLSDKDSGVYSWRDDGEILVTVFSQPFPLGEDAKREEVWKLLGTDEYDAKFDVDMMALQKLFKDSSLFPAKVEWVQKLNLSFEEVKNYLKSIGKKTYDCFVFVFLTYSESTGTKYADERLHFNHTELDKGVVPLGHILEVVKEIEVAIGKPKVFLIQADDISLIEGMSLKGRPVPPREKIPQDSDRLIIKSTIPQVIANQVLKHTEQPPQKKNKTTGKQNEEKSPSFLIKAFVEAVRENATRSGNRYDLLSLTTCINEKVEHMIGQWNMYRDSMTKSPQTDETTKTMSAKLMVPLTTSTLTKLLNLYK